MSEEKQEFTTPYRGTQDKEAQETGVKQGEESHVVSVDPTPPPEEEQQDQLQSKLSSLENQIRQTQERLRLVKQKKRQVEVDSEQYQNLEDERRVLRKHLIDLDYEHKVLFEQYKKKNQEEERQRSESKLKQLEEEYQQIQEQREKQRLQRSRRLEEQLEDIKNQQSRRRAQISRISEKRQEPQEEKDAADIKPTQSKVQEQPSPAEGQQESRAPADQGESSLEEARHKARVAEIEAELASQRLRRSRQVQLEAELIRIRTDYPLYSWWRYYPYSYRLFLGPYDYPSYPLYPYLRYPSLLDYPLYPYRRYYPFF